MIDRILVRRKCVTATTDFGGIARTFVLAGSLCRSCSRIQTIATVAYYIGQLEIYCKGNGLRTLIAVFSAKEIVGGALLSTHL